MKARKKEGHVKAVPLFALVSVLFACSAPPDLGLEPTDDVARAAPLPSGSKTVKIQCGTGQTSSTSGLYGGASVGVGCSKGRFSTQIIIPAGTVWSFRIGVETVHTATDCAFNGDSDTVSVDCVGTTLTVQ